MITTICVIFLVILNIITFVLFYIDNQKKLAREERYPDALLFTLALFGGSLAAVLAMRILDTRNHNANFFMGMPLLLLIHTVALLIILTHNL